MNRRTILSLSALCALSWFVACSSGLGKNKRVPAAPATTASSLNLPVGVDLGLIPTDPVAEPTVAGLVVPAIGGGSAREVILLGFSSAARSDDGNGSGQPLARDTTVDGNGTADVFLAAIAASDVERDAFSQRLAGKFRHPRCTTCHSMQAAGTLAFASSPLAHAGPQPGSGFPSNDPASCAPCHVTSTNFPVEGWMAPAASFDIRSKTVAQLAAMAQNVPTGETQHFVSDRRVLWALDSGLLPAVNDRNGIADDDHDGVLEPEDSDGVVRTVPGGSAAFLADIVAWHATGDVVTNAGAVQDVTLVSRANGTANAANGSSTAPRLLWVANPGFDPTNASTAAATNPIGTLYVAFQSAASDLVGGDGNGALDVFRATVELRAEEDANGAPAAGALNLRVTNGATILVSGRNGTTTPGDAASGHPSIGGADGEWITFESAASDLVAVFTDGNGAGTDIYLRNTGTQATTLVSHAIGNVATGGNGTSEAPAIDPTGVAVAFESDATDLLALDANSVRDVFYARVDGGSPYTQVRASVTGTGAEGTGGASSAASVQASGSRILVAFQSAKTDLATIAANPNVFLFDSNTGHTTLLNQQATAGTDATVPGDGAAQHPTIAADGSVVAFASAATNLDVLRSDGNRKSDIFLVETAQLDSGLVLPYRISVGVDTGADADGDSTRPVMGVFGADSEHRVGFAAYSTTATNLGTSDSTGVMVAFLGETSGVLANFTTSTTLGGAPLTVQFTDRSTGDPTSWAWDFDLDGTVDSTAQNPTHVFATAGLFSVRLVATNARASGTKTATDAIRVLGPVVADFTFTSGSTNLSIEFTDTSTEEPDTWAWDFGDGSTSTQQHPTHTFPAAGTYTVSLSASGPGGPSLQPRTASVTVTPTIPAPNVTISSDLTSGPLPLTVNFAYSNSGGPISSGGVTWTFDDPGSGAANSSNLDAPTHVFNTAATYTVTLSVTGPGGQSSDTQVIVVSTPTWTEVYATMRPGAVGTNCTLCHRTPAVGGAPFPMDSQAIAYSSLVGVLATTGTCTSTNRVTAGNSNQSTLVNRLQGTSCGTQMNGLTPNQIAAVIAWIDAGAQNN